jgi:predicted transcriptional regulator
MLVENWISKDVISVDINDSMQDATRIFRKHKIKHLQVMENGKQVGIGKG